MKIEQIIKESQNPLVIAKLIIESPIEVLVSAIQKESEKNKSIIPQPYHLEIVDISDNISYIFTRKKTLIQIQDFLDSKGIEWNIVDSSQEIWNMTESQLKQLYTHCGDEKIKEELDLLKIPTQSERISEMLKLFYQNSYTVDNVLDKMSYHGKNSLNQINRFILELQQEI